MNPNEIELTFLGSGTSHGVPMIGCDCAVCRSDDPRDKRNRASVAIGTAGGSILVDAPPELRLAAVAWGLGRVDAILFTHAHADHIMGLDDVRRFNDIVGSTIDCYCNAPCLQRLRAVFGYAEVVYDKTPANRPSLRFELMEEPRRICGVDVVPVPLLHGSDEVLGFRFGSMAYCTDCSAIPPASAPLLEGLDLLVLDALRHTPHPTHFSLAEALEVIAELRPKKALLTHIAHQLGHEATSRDLPDNVAMAYDGLSVRARL